MSDFSRREFVKAAGLAVSAVATTGTAIAADTSVANVAKKEGLVLKFGGYDFPRLAGLTDGRVPIKGCELEFVPGKVGDMNSDLFGGEQIRDVTEIGLHPFILAYANGGLPGDLYRQEPPMRPLVL